MHRPFMLGQRIPAKMPALLYKPWSGWTGLSEHARPMVRRSTVEDARLIEVGSLVVAKP